MAMAEHWVNGVLVTRWNETNKRVETMNPDGTVASFVPMTPEESAQADAHIASQAAIGNKRTVDQAIAQDLAAMQTIIDTTNATINQNPAAHIKTIARAIRRLDRAALGDYTGSS